MSWRWSFAAVAEWRCMSTVGATEAQVRFIGRDFGDAAVVAADERVPKRLARAHAVGPRQMVEPEQIIVGNAVQIGEAAADLRRILGDGIAAGRGPVEADALERPRDCNRSGSTAARADR